MRSFRSAWDLPYGGGITVPPGRTMNGYEVWLASIAELTPAQTEKLLGRLGSAQAVWDNPGEAAALLPASAADALRSSRTADRIEKLERVMEREKITLITRDDETYPLRLRCIPGAPAYLFVQGSPDLTDERTVAVVGTRTCSAYGARMARRIARDLADAGVTVISGLAAGIDAMAHQGTVDVGGRTVAVTGCGLDIVYPRENEPLRDRILETGGSVVSEYGPGVRPARWRFPARNRIIAGMADALMLVEGKEKSGSLITARDAAELGRTVFVLPGQADSPQSQGSNLLLREWGVAANSAADILEDLGWTPGTAGSGTGTGVPAQPLTGPEAAVVRALSGGAARVEELLEVCGMEPRELNTVLTSLEILGIIRQLPGRRVERTEQTEE